MTDAAYNKGDAVLIGAHAIIYSTKPDADRVFLRDVLRLPNVDVGHGWLIFGLPPSELAVHPSGASRAHELYLMCDNVEAFVAEMQTRNVICAPVNNQGWGLLTQLTLPGGGTLGVYEPRHARPKAMAGAIAAKKSPPRQKQKAANRVASKVMNQRTKR
jgi:hypothetical protein